MCFVHLVATELLKLLVIFNSCVIRVGLIKNSVADHELFQILECSYNKRNLLSNYN